MKTIGYCGDIVFIQETEEEMEVQLLTQGHADILAKTKQTAIDILHRNGFGYEYFYFNDGHYAHIMKRPEGMALKEEEY